MNDEIEQLDLKKLRAGDPESFRELVRQNGPVVRAWIAGQVGDAHLAEELTHESFIAIWEALPKYRDEGKLRAWLLGIAANRVRMHWRSAQRRDRKLERYRETVAAMVEAQSSTQMHSRLAVLEACMMKFPERTLALLNRRYFDGESARALAQEFDLKPGTVKQILFRAKLDLRSCMQREKAW